jgi:lipid-binding SYLF domain-containing protein
LIRMTAMRKLSSLLLAIVCLSLVESHAEAQPLGREQALILAASDVLTDAIAFVDRGVPRILLQEAYGVAVFPNVLRNDPQAGGGLFSEQGLLVARTEEGAWSSPVFVSLDKLGSQIRAAETDIVLLFMTKRAIDDFRDGELDLVSDDFIAAGPPKDGPGIEAILDLGVDIYSYARSREGFSGVSLRGATLHFDKSANEVYYWTEGITPDPLLAGRGLTEPLAGNAFTCLLSRFSGTVQLC